MSRWAEEHLGGWRGRQAGSLGQAEEVEQCLTELILSSFSSE